MPPDPDNASIETERLRSVFQQTPLTLVVVVISTTLTAVVLAPVVSHRLLSIWVALVFAVAGARWAVRGAFLRWPPKGAQYRLFAGLSILGSCLTGALWGLGVAALQPVDEIYQLFVAFVIGSMCAAAAAVNAAHLPTVLAFTLPAGLPLAAYLVAEGTTPRVVSAIIVLMYVAALSLTSLRAHRAFGERLRLNLALSRQRRELSEAYTRLREEVAERKKSEAFLQQAQKMEAIGHLTGGIAHDFNNLLQIVNGSLSRIQRLAEGNPQIVRYVERAEQAVARGGQLTASLLAFARRQTLQAERVDLNPLLQEFRPILLQAIDQKNRLEMTLGPELPACYVDSAQFQSAILNLVINARDALSPEGGHISIETTSAMLEQEELLANPDAKPGRFVSVSVCDDGAGMTEEVQERVFEPFYTTKEAGKGSGLGLSQVYGFVHQSGGHIRLRSEPARGTCVTLFLPAVNE